jgi:DNA-binding transcriptional regulator PaaX
VTLYFLILLPSKNNQIDIRRLSDEALDFVGTTNYDSIKSALYQLTRTGLITRSPKRLTLDATISAKGKKYIEERIPIYRSVRPWDGHVYLISYDIPTKANHKRSFLRKTVKALSGAPLQESLYMTPYNPTAEISELVATYAIPGNILISNLGIGGSVGEESLTDLVARVYDLDTLAKRYTRFLELFPLTAKPSVSAMLSYLSILHDDPQLPFELLPPNFPDKRAYDRYITLHP